MTETTKTMKLISEDTEVVVEESGETGGPEFNLGREFSKRFTWETGNPEEPYASATTTTYIQARSADGEEVAVEELDDKKNEMSAWQERYAEACREHSGRDLDRWLDENPQPVRFFWSEQTEFIVHSDPEDVGGSEIRSDYEYGEGSYLFFDSVEKAEEEAKAAVDRENPDYYSPANF